MAPSREEAVHEPARLVHLAPVKALAEEPEAPSRLVLDDVVVARRLRVLLAPPLGRDPLRPLRMGDAMRPSAPAEPTRRPLRHHGDDIRRLGLRQEKRGPRRRFLFRRPLRRVLDIAAQKNGALRDMACDRPWPGEAAASETLREGVDQRNRAVLRAVVGAGERALPGP